MNKRSKAIKIPTHYCSTHNRTRVEAIGLPRPPSMVIAGVTLKGTTPTFYKINVSTELAIAVSQGVYPDSPTIVYTHVPDVH